MWLFLAFFFNAHSFPFFYCSVFEQIPEPPPVVAPKRSFLSRIFGYEKKKPFLATQPQPTKADRLRALAQSRDARWVEEALKSIAEQPEELVDRLAIADLLLEKGFNDEAEFIIAQVAPERWRVEYGPQHGGKRADARAKELLAENHKWLPASLGEDAYHSVSFRKGFPHRLSLNTFTAPKMAGKLESILDAAPTLRELSVVGVTWPSVKDLLAQVPKDRPFRELALTSHHDGHGNFERFDSLDLTKVLTSTSLNLEKLELVGKLDPEPLTSLSKVPWISKLRTLEFDEIAGRYPEPTDLNFLTGLRDLKLSNLRHLTITGVAADQNLVNRLRETRSLHGITSMKIFFSRGQNRQEREGILRDLKQIFPKVQDIQY